MSALPGTVLIIIPFLAAIAVSALATPAVARFAIALNVVDRPSERSVSKRGDMPLMGGLAIALGFFTGLAVAVMVFPEGARFVSRLEGLVIGALLLVVIGAWDDQGNLGPFAKLGVQVLAAYIAFMYGFRLEHFTEPITGASWIFPEWISAIATVFWIVGITNAINLMDGLDGLATGISAIIALTLAFIAWQMNEVSAIVIAVVLIGSLIGFLPYNFPPARIFLGDTGSLFVGFLLSLICLEGYRQVAVVTFVVPLLVLAVPIIDTLLSIIRRIVRGTAIFAPDRHHLHHRLLEVHRTHKAAVLSIYFITACFCVIAVSFTRLTGTVAVAVLIAVVLLTIRLLMNLGIFEYHDQAAESPPSEKQSNEGYEI